MRSVMSHSFSQVPQAKIQRSSFNRSHGYKTTFNAGYLVPFYLDEVLPGDTFKVNPHIFARLATPFVPFMDNLFADTFFFFCPTRLVHNNWQKLNGEQEDPGDSTDFLAPIITQGSGAWNPLSLGDYFGIPTGVDNLVVSALPFRAYNLIYNEWFRDQNLQNSVTVPKDDGPDAPGTYSVLRRGKRHDYFTSALPWPQKGPSVPLPLGTEAPVYGYPVSGTVNSGHIFQSYQSGTGPSVGVSGVNSSNQVYYSGTLGGNDRINFQLGSKGDYEGGTIPNAVPPYADLTDATASTINELRMAFQIQRLYERDARGGTRYIEILRSHFGVISPDARLQRPEYLGGNSTPVTVSPIAQNSASGTGDTPQGNLAAIGSFTKHGGGFVKSFTEHGFVIGLISVRADLNYQQGLNRMWSRRDRFDFYWPALSHLGEQAVLNKEIYAQGTSVDEEVFGYQERFAEYRYKPSLITGKLRSSDPQSLDIWHLAQDFSSLPSLSATFIQENPPVDRVIAVPSEPHFIMDSYIENICVRPMPVFSVPGLIDHL